jgi:hypothetical protein
MGESQILDYASTGLITQNIFRELDLNASASLREILRRQKMAELEAGLAEKSSEEDLKDYGERKSVSTILQDPVQRLLHRIFWLWLDEGAAPEEVEGGRIPLDYYQTAVAYWEDRIKSGRSSISALHNLAVIYQSVFLAAYEGGQKFSASSEASGEIETYYRKSLEYWEKVAGSRNFWQNVFGWAAVENDPRLNTEFLQDLKRQFLPFLIVIFLDSAWRMYRAGHKKESLRIIEHIQAANFTEKHQSTALSYYFDLLEGEVRAHLREARVEIGNQKPSMLHALIHQSVGRVDELISFARPLAADNPQRAFALMDSAAMHYLDILSDMNGKDEYLHIHLQLLEEIAAFPVSQRLVNKADESHKTLMEKKSSENTWFTEQYFELKGAVFTALEKARKLLAAQDFKGALDTLESFDLQKFDSESPQFGAVMRGLAVVQNARGKDHMDAMYKAITTPRTLYTRLRSGMHNQFFNISRCESCGTSLYGRYYEISIDNLTYMVCSDCGARDSEQVQGIREQARASLISARDCFNIALKKNPGNRVAKQNLDLVHETAHKMDFSLPSAPTTVRQTHQPSQSSTPRGLKYAESQSNKDNSANYAILALFGIVLLVLCMVGVLS